MAIALVFTLLVTLGILWPLLTDSAECSSQHAPPAQTNLEDQRDRCVQVLKDLELDYSTEKLSRADYDQMKRTLTAELGEILKKLDDQ